MPRKTQAVVFDLDDTLYPFDQFRRSGFGAVAAYLDHTRGIDSRAAYRQLSRASRGPGRGRELQLLLEAMDLPRTLLPELVDLVRHHIPSLKLPPASLRVLNALRQDWKLGILTNGSQSTQARKVAGLGVAPLVDAVVYAVQHGSGMGKPEPAPFLAIADRLRVAPSRVVFVGDDETADIRGAAGVGMRTVRVTKWRAAPRGTTADALVASIAELPKILPGIFRKAPVRHAA